MKAEKVICFFLVLLFLLCPAIAFAEEEENEPTDSISWSFDEATGTFTVSGTGRMTDYWDDDNWDDIPAKTPWDDVKPKIKKVVIEDGVTKIGVHSFMNCENLVKVQMADSVEIINSDAFEYCKSLTDVQLSKNLTFLEGFGYCESLKNIELPNKLEEIGSFAFERCDSLEKIVVPDSVKLIFYHAFRECASLKTVVLGSGVEEIMNPVFDLTTGVKNLTISPDNKFFSVKDGSIYNKDCTVLYEMVPEGKAREITVPKGVKVLRAGSISSPYLNTINIPLSVESIKWNAIGSYILNNINYEGSEADWAKVETGDDSSITYAKLNYNQAEIFKTAADYHTSISLSLNKKTINVGKSAVLTADINEPYGKTVYSSSNKKIATVSSTGKIKGVGIGKAKLTVKNNNKSRSVYINVYPAYSGKSSYTKTIGDKGFRLTINKGKNGKLSYISSDKSIAAVSKEGKVSLKNCGIAVITVKAAANFGKQVKVKEITVSVKPQKAKIISILSDTLRFKTQKNVSGYECTVKNSKGTFRKNVKSGTVKLFSTSKGKNYISVRAFVKSGSKTVYGDADKRIVIKR